MVLSTKSLISLMLSKGPGCSTSKDADRADGLAIHQLDKFRRGDGVELIVRSFIHIDDCPGARRQRYCDHPDFQPTTEFGSDNQVIKDAIGMRSQWHVERAQGGDGKRSDDIYHVTSSPIRYCSLGTF